MLTDPDIWDAATAMIKRYGSGLILVDAIYSALTMSGEARARRAKGLKDIVTSRDPGDWIDEQVADIRKKARGMAPTGT